MLLVFTVLSGLLYPLVVTGVAQGLFEHGANGSLVKVDGKVVGSRWIGQPFTAPEYFHPRPSADDYVPGAQGGGTYSFGSNYGPTDPRLIGNVPGVSITEKTNVYATPDDPYCLPVQATDKDENPITDKAGNPVYEKNRDGTYVCDPSTVPQRVRAYREENGLPKDADVPVDAVTATASGLDPHVSVANARLQASRVAKARRMALADVLGLVEKRTDERALGFLGEPGVNVLELNVALDGLKR
jgi:K+-transporting ATPase ATPase C chain